MAEWLADRHDALLINSDAFQVYRGLDIGTNKPIDRSRYRMLDLVDPDEEFGVRKWIEAVLPLLSNSFDRGRNVIVVGGTGYYVRALFEEYGDLQEAPAPELRAALNERIRMEGVDALARELTERAPEVAKKIDLKNPARVQRAIERLESTSPLTFRLPPFRKIKIALAPSAEQLTPILESRVEQMIATGWPDEVASLLDSGVKINAPGMRAIGYRALANVVSGRITLGEAREQIILETRQYAKRQRTWLRSEPNLKTMPLPDTWPNEEPWTTGSNVERIIHSGE
ncbi:MAG: tRNA (adenosine(37)-N6)-dimethylallyltransferase MiaA [Fimbriimonadaceae bacterium]|nr:tRNA (adenosine(37)-N6)-dimethylallyltransferase MiaA [Fimbriimonadaceae bacterium]